MIRLLVIDVDGTLTDGKIYMGNSGELMKAFNIKDGFGIAHILPKYGIEPVIITGRKSEIVNHRAKELNIKYCCQGIIEKMLCVEQILNELGKIDGIKYSLTNVAYIGDDVLDLICMQQIAKAKGVVGCPNDAIIEIKDLANFVSAKNGGDGAVREFIEYLVRNV